MSLSLAIRNVVKSYGGRQILQRCSLEFPECGVTVLKGPNGSGKSTLLRICALLERPEGGEVIYRENGEVLPHDLSLRRKITLVLPGVSTFNTTVFRNVAYGLHIRGVSDREVRARVEHSLERVGLAPLCDQDARTLSSGEKQRLGIARALVVDPDILFLDEPTSSVDQENSVQIHEMILSMKSAGRPMVVMSTHDEAEARSLADSIHEIRSGLLFPLPV